MTFDTDIFTSHAHNVSNVRYTRWININMYILCDKESFNK